jgi:hypothetical protein
MQLRRVVGLVGAATLAVTVACSSAITPTSDTQSTSSQPAVNTAAAVPTAAASAPASVQLESGLPGFSRATVGWNGYWYSRYNLGELTDDVWAGHLVPTTC